ncbi:uncharacterized protein LOC108110016 [Drosophila eugracilis]|uniref:uncharacterized protein LOC108110016 n=1 Tax=Drosophila eugracilis TaxID=29029 RepID=UPI0007E8A7F1|nr:uncharacterized protein LOC108110016 [Drosophila eugracilis]
MGAQLSGEKRAEAGGTKEEERAEGGTGVQQEDFMAKKADETVKLENSDKELPREEEDGEFYSSDELLDQEQEYIEPVFGETLKLMGHRSGYITTDIQRMPTEAIYAEFERLMQNVESHLKEVVDPPCADMAARLQTCLQNNNQRSCNCFSAMEQYRNCIVLATQRRVDDLAERDPPMMPYVQPQPMPGPAIPPQKPPSNRRWWKFWTWFR